MRLGSPAADVLSKAADDEPPYILRSEPALPESRHLACPVDQRAKSAELRAVVRVAAFVAVAHQACLLQDPEMLRDDRLRDTGPSRQSPDRLLAFAAKPFEERPPSLDQRAF